MNIKNKIIHGFTVTYLGLWLKYCLTMGYSKIESRKSDVDLLVYAQHWLADLKLAAEIRWTLDEPVQEVSADVVHRNEAREYLIK